MEPQDVEKMITHRMESLHSFCARLQLVKRSKKPLIFEGLLKTLEIYQNGDDKVFASRHQLKTLAELTHAIFVAHSYLKQIDILNMQAVYRIWNVFKISNIIVQMH